MRRTKKHCLISEHNTHSIIIKCIKYDFTCRYDTVLFMFVSLYGPHSMSFVGNILESILCLMVNYNQFTNNTTYFVFSFSSFACYRILVSFHRVSVPIKMQLAVYHIECVVCMRMYINVLAFSSWALGRIC